MNILESYFQNEDCNKIFCEILSFFLPLDIDMQALQILFNDEELSKEVKFQKIKDYLINADDSMLRDKTVDYVGKLRKAQEETNKIQKLVDNKILKELLGIGTNNSKISDFFLLLDEKKQKIINGRTIEDSEMNDIITHFPKDSGWKVKGAKPEIIINSFHDWYCALADCLRDERAKLKRGD